MPGAVLIFFLLKKFGGYKKSAYLCNAFGKNPFYRRLGGYDSLAQLVEHNTFNVGVVGSSPTRITKANKTISI